MTTPHSILLVDDDRFLLDMYVMKFQKSGMTVDTASSATDGLAKLRAGKYDIVLLDIIMPGMDGLEMLTAMRTEKIASDSTVVMLTNQADEMEKAKSLGIDGFIIKATSIPSEVVDKVMNIYKDKHK